jgi:hypothetical protein
MAYPKSRKVRCQKDSKSARSSKRRDSTLEQNDERAVQRARYMTLETMAALSDDAIVGLPAMVI